jgi:hypothetical protein
MSLTLIASSLRLPPSPPLKPPQFLLLQNRRTDNMELITNTRFVATVKTNKRTIICEGTTLNELYEMMREYDLTADMIPENPAVSGEPENTPT